MKTRTSRNTRFAVLKSALLITAALMLSVAAPVQADNDECESSDTSKVVRPHESYRGQTYAEWSAEWWQWALTLPVDGHPFIDTPDFNVRAGQHGNVWFLAPPNGTVERTCTIPKNKALFIGLLNVEASSLEEPPFFGATEAEQRALAKNFADHIVTTTLFFTIDGVPVKHLERYRVSSPQFEFTAPTPWIFGATGGEGTSVGDGVYVLIEPLAKGQHTLHFGGLFHFSVAEGDLFDAEIPIDMTYHLSVK